MTRLDPKDRPPLQIAPLIDALAQHGVRWVMCGSQVLKFYGAEIAPNDLDVVPDLTPANLKRVATCLKSLDAVAAFLDGWGGARGSYAACQNWQPNPPTAEHLDWLYVTQFGMLDIVIEKAEPYASLMDGASEMLISGHSVSVCDPRRVLKALEPRQRKKDAARQSEYQRLRKQFGMPELPPSV